MIAWAPAMLEELRQLLRELIRLNGGDPDVVTDPVPPWERGDGVEVGPDP